MTIFAAKQGNNLMCRQHRDLRRLLWVSYIFWDIQTLIHYWDLSVFCSRGQYVRSINKNTASLWSENPCTLKGLFYNTLLEETSLSKSNKTGFESIYVRLLGKYFASLFIRVVRSFAIRMDNWNVSCKNISNHLHSLDKIYSRRNIFGGHYTLFISKNGFSLT